MTWLLRLYPRKWRERYGAEIEAIVAAQPFSLQLVVDLLGGAVDAHLKPQALARRLEGQAADPTKGSDMVTRLKGCDAAAGMTVKESLLGGALTLGAGLAVAAFLMSSDDVLAEAIVLSMFPGILVLPVQIAYLRGHSWPARIALIAGPLVVLFLIGLLAGLAVSD